MADTNELIDVCTDLIRLVEGVGCKDWRDQNGQRFKDTNEWVRAYVAINNARKESREKSTQPADAALADLLRSLEIQSTNNHVAKDKRTASADYCEGIAKGFDECLRIVKQHAAALRARAVPEGFVIVPRYPDTETLKRMHEAYWLTNTSNYWHENSEPLWRKTYYAMLAASQQAAKGEVE